MSKKDGMKNFLNKLKSADPDLAKKLESKIKAKIKDKKSKNGAGDIEDMLDFDPVDMVRLDLYKANGENKNIQ